MGTDAAIFRTMGKQTAMRTDQYNSRWLNGELGCHWPRFPGEPTAPTQRPIMSYCILPGERQQPAWAGRWVMVWDGQTDGWVVR